MYFCVLKCFFFFFTWWYKMYFMWILDLWEDSIMVHRGCIKQVITACMHQSSLNRPVPGLLLYHKDSDWNLHRRNLHHRQLWATMETNFQTSWLFCRQLQAVNLGGGACLLWTGACWVIYAHVLPPGPQDQILTVYFSRLQATGSQQFR